MLISVPRRDCSLLDLDDFQEGWHGSPSVVTSLMTEVELVILLWSSAVDVETVAWCRVLSEMIKSSSFFNSVSTGSSERLFFEQKLLPSLLETRLNRDTMVRAIFFLVSLLIVVGFFRLLAPTDERRREHGRGNTIATHEAPEEKTQNSDAL